MSANSRIKTVYEQEFKRKWTLVQGATHIASAHAAFVEKKIILEVGW